jgi:hypothetical protein
MLVNCGINRREFLQQTVLATGALSMPQTKQDFPQAEYAITLGTWPHRIYKENDGLLEPASTESFVFNLLVKENQNRPLDPLSARLAFYAAEDKVHMLELSRKALDAIRGVLIATRGADSEDEVFDFRHYFSLPISLNADQLVYEVVLLQAGREVRYKLEIPLLRYEQKTKLIFRSRASSSSDSATTSMSRTAMGAASTLPMTFWERVRIGRLREMAVPQMPIFTRGGGKS